MVDIFLVGLRALRLWELKLGYLERALSMQHDVDECECLFSCDCVKSDVILCLGCVLLVDPSEAMIQCQAAPVWLTDLSRLNPDALSLAVVSCIFIGQKVGPRRRHCSCAFERLEDEKYIEKY